MGKLNHAQLRLIEQIYIDGDDPFAAPEELNQEEVYPDAPQEETHTQESPAASQN